GAYPQAFRMPGRFVAAARQILEVVDLRSLDRPQLTGGATTRGRAGDVSGGGGEPRFEIQSGFVPPHPRDSVLCRDVMHPRHRAAVGLRVTSRCVVEFRVPTRRNSTTHRLVTRRPT